MLISLSANGIGKLLIKFQICEEVPQPYPFVLWLTLGSSSNSLWDIALARMLMFVFEKWSVFTWLLWHKCQFSNGHWQICTSMWYARPVCAFVLSWCGVSFDFFVLWQSYIEPYVTYVCFSSFLARYTYGQPVRGSLAGSVGKVVKENYYYYYRQRESTQLGEEQDELELTDAVEFIAVSLSNWKREPVYGCIVLANHKVNPVRLLNVVIEICFISLVLQKFDCLQ